MSKTYLLALPVLLSMALGACSGNVQEDLGLKRKAPDEFAVVKRAPLELPPAYNLRPPEPGAPRPQEQTTAQQARQTVFGGENKVETEGTDGEAVFLEQAGVQLAAPNIRATVDSESAEYVDKNKPVAEKLLGIFGDKEPEAAVVNAPKEAERLKKNMEEGKDVDEEETPSIED